MNFLNSIFCLVLVGAAGNLYAESVLSDVVSVDANVVDTQVIEQQQQDDTSVTTVSSEAPTTVDLGSTSEELDEDPIETTEMDDTDNEESEDLETFLNELQQEFDRQDSEESL